MFGFGTEARQRREAVKIMYLAMVRAHVDLVDEPSDALPHPALADELMGRVSKWPTRRFAGHALPNPSAVGLAMEALSYGMDELSARPADQQLVIGALGQVLRDAAEHQDKINDADYELFQLLGKRYVTHPLVANQLDSAV